MKEALKLALDSLEYWDVHGGLHQPTEEAITAIKAALAQPTSGDYALGYVEGFNDACKPKPAQQEPVAWWNDTGTHIDLNVSGRGTPLYTTPPQQEPWCMKMNGCKTKCEDCPVEVAEQEHAAHAVIAGALFDFMGWLTSREERIVLSSADEASPAVDAISNFAKMRGLSLDDAKVQDWNTTPPQPEERNFCSRCGKRTADLTVIHTCTPPQENT